MRIAPRSSRVRIASAAPTIASVYGKLVPRPPKRPPGPIRVGGPPTCAASGGAMRPPSPYPRRKAPTISVKSTSPIRSATHVSRLLPRLREAHRASTTSASPTDTANANFASPVRASDGIEHGLSKFVHEALSWLATRCQPNRVARSREGLHRRRNSKQIVMREDRAADGHVGIAVDPPNDRSSKGHRDVVVVSNRPCSDRDI